MTILNLVKGTASALLVSLLCSTAVFAQGNVAGLTGGNIEAGQQKAMVCVACHGESGNESLLPNVPKLGGQGEKYLLKQLQEIKNNVRVVPLMTGIVAPLTEQDLADLSAYYASLPAPQGAADPERSLDVAEVLYRAGNADIGVAACSACHSPTGNGNAPAGYPALTGQDTAYTELQLRLFRTGERTNDDAEVMRTIAARLNDAEIAALASYVSGLR